MQVKGNVESSSIGLNFTRLDMQTTGWCLNIIHGILPQPHFFSFLFQNWLTFDSLHRPLFKEHSNVSFQNDVLPAKNHNFAFCEVRMVKIMRN